MLPSFTNTEERESLLKLILKMFPVWKVFLSDRLVYVICLDDTFLELNFQDQSWNKIITNKSLPFLNHQSLEECLARHYADKFIKLERST